MENVSNRLELLTANDGHAVISVQTTGARMRDVCACRRHQTTWTAGWRD